MLKATIIKSTGSWFTALTGGGKQIPCRIKGKFRIKNIKNTNPVAVGDYVKLELESDGNGIITDIEERENYIIRKSTKLSKKYHIIASNVDQAILVISATTPWTSTFFIDRFLVTAEAYSIPVTIILNKIDIYEEKDQLYAGDIIETYENIGYKTLLVSALENKGLNNLVKILTGKRSLLSGHSGVGKSTLINKIDPSFQLKTSNLSTLHQRGKHTTTFAEMHHLKNIDAYVIDTPGVKSFGIIDFEKPELYHYFPEFFRYSKNCQFSNCVHIEEPKCAVKSAVKTQKIAISRYENYLRLYNGEDLEDEY